MDTRRFTVLKKSVCYGFDRSRLKSGQSNKQMLDFCCRADNLLAQKQGLFSSFLRSPPPPLVLAPPLFTCATDHTQTRPRMSPSFLKCARICICGHEYVKGSQSVPCAGDYPEYISAPVFPYPFFFGSSHICI